MSFYVENHDDHEEAKSIEKVHYQDEKEFVVLRKMLDKDRIEDLMPRDEILSNLSV